MCSYHSAWKDVKGYTLDYGYKCKHMNILQSSEFIWKCKELNWDFPGSRLIRFHLGALGSNIAEAFRNLATHISGYDMQVQTDQFSIASPRPTPTSPQGGPLIWGKILLHWKFIPAFYMGTGVGYSSHLTIQLDHNWSKSTSTPYTHIRFIFPAKFSWRLWMFEMKKKEDQSQPTMTFTNLSEFYQFEWFTMGSEWFSKEGKSSSEQHWQ